MEGVGGGVGWEAHQGHAPLVSGIKIDTTYKLMGEVPVMAAAMGACAGVTGARVAVSHFSVMTKAACIFAGGPPLVERALGHRIDKFVLGGVEVHAIISGVVDNIAEDDADAIRQIKTVLSYLPQNVWEMPPYVPTDDPPERQDEVLLEIMPEDQKGRLRRAGTSSRSLPTAAPSSKSAATAHRPSYAASPVSEATPSAS